MTDTQAIKDRLDIVALIGEYVQLKKAGSNWKGRCPFHNEKSPSFMVQRDKQIWHCFGCGKGGDAFSFIQEMEGLDFVSALKLLADKAGVKIESYKNEINTSERNRILQVLDSATHFYHQFLLEIPAAQIARDYLQTRKLNSATIKDWQIGYAPEQWDLLTKYLLKKGFGVDDLVGAGLTIMREGADSKTGRGYYDRFRGRIMFPLCDAHGSTVGFTGRVIKETETSGGKYVNTPQTIVYDKSRTLFGLSKAKTEIKAKDLVVVVEGQMDVIASHQAGIKNVVAASGTALTPDQIRIIKRYTENVALCFDADAAGEKAGARGIDVALQEGMNVKVIQLLPPAGKDADETIKKDVALWSGAISKAVGVMDWYFTIAFQNKNLNDAKVKRAVAELLISRIQLIPFAIEREHWIKKLSEMLHIEISVLREELKKPVKNSTVVGKNPEPKISVPEPKIVPLIPDELTLRQNPLLSFQTEWWSLIIKFPAIFAKLLPDTKEDYFVNTPYAMLYEKAKSLYTNVGSFNTESLRQSYAGADQNIVDILLLRPYKNFEELTDAVALEEAAIILNRIKDLWKKKRTGEIKDNIAVAQSNGDKEQVKLLLQELQIL